MKITKTLFFSALTAGTLVLGAAMPTQAQAFPGGGKWRQGQAGARQGGPLAKLIQSLNLTPDQRTQLMPIMQEMRPKFQAARQQAAGNPEAMKASMESLIQELRTKVDPILTAAQKDQVAQAVAKFKERKDKRSQVMASLNLTADQKTKLEALKKDMMQNRKAMKDSRKNFREELKKILTPEQLEKLKAAMKEKRGMGAHPDSGEMEF